MMGQLLSRMWARIIGNAITTYHPSVLLEKRDVARHGRPRTRLVDPSIPAYAWFQGFHAVSPLA